MKNFWLFLVFISILMTSSFAAEEEIKLKAEEILQPLKQNLMQTLQSEVKAKGIIGGVEACQIEAPKIAEALQEKSQKIELGRTSHRLRNPNNAPREWVKPYLDEFVKSGKTPSVKVIRLDEGRYGYIEPIFLAQPLCLKCHGSEIDSEVLTAINKLYPSDQATGFKAGEFRGFFWVEM